jgi:hypothetical protein
MIPSQNTRVRVALNGTVSTSALTYGPRVDCAGADSATFVVHLEATNATGTNGLTNIILEESDLTTTASFTTITGFNYTATQITAATVANDVTVAASGPVAVLSTSLVGRKRFIRIGARGHSSATAAIKVQSICILDALGVAGTAPSGATVNVFAP